MAYWIYFIWQRQRRVVDCINSAVELITVKTGRTRCCYGSEMRFTDGESALYCVHSFKEQTLKIQMMVENTSSPEL